MKAGYEVLVEAGYSPEMAYFECLHELKLIVDLMNESGIAGMRFSISETAEYGDVTVGPKIINESVKNRMRRQLKTIESGKFAKEWVGEFKAGCKNFNKIRKSEEKHGIEKVGAKLRGMMTLLGKKAKSVGKGVAGELRFDLEIKRERSNGPVARTPRRRPLFHQKGLYKAASLRKRRLYAKSEKVKRPFIRWVVGAY